MLYLEAKATDDALELFDVIMTSELLARAERQSNADKLSRYARLDKDASRLASAVSVSLAADGRLGSGRALHHCLCHRGDAR